MSDIVKKRVRKRTNISKKLFEKKLKKVLTLTDMFDIVLKATAN